MSTKSGSSVPLLEEMVILLVRRFGAERVQAALARALPFEPAKLTRPQHNKVAASAVKSAVPSISDTIEDMRERDPNKYRLLSEFYTSLRERQVLPESQDIRHFAQIAGLKHVIGKSRKEMLPSVVRFLMTRDSDQLQSDIELAKGISEHERQQGFSVLADKLLSDR